MRLIKPYHYSEMNSKVALTEMVPESIMFGLRKLCVAVPERSSASAIDPLVIATFRCAVDLFEARDGWRMEQLFDRLQLIPEFLNTPMILSAYANMIEVGSCLGCIVAYTTFLTHACARRARAGTAIDDAYLDLVITSLDYTGIELDWQEVCRLLDVFREQAMTDGYEEVCRKFLGSTNNQP